MKTGGGIGRPGYLGGCVPMPIGGTSTSRVCSLQGLSAGPRKARLSMGCAWRGPAINGVRLESPGLLYSQQSRLVLRHHKKPLLVFYHHEETALVVGRGRTTSRKVPCIKRYRKTRKLAWPLLVLLRARRRNQGARQDGHEPPPIQEDPNR